MLFFVAIVSFYGGVYMNPNGVTLWEVIKIGATVSIGITFNWISWLISNDPNPDNREASMRC